MTKLKRGDFMNEEYCNDCEVFCEFCGRHHYVEEVEFVNASSDDTGDIMDFICPETKKETSSYVTRRI